jgi:tripartite-type tricarboxylate transporter receptor subunit TctC
MSREYRCHSQKQFRFRIFLTEVAMMRDRSSNGTNRRKVLAGIMVAPFLSRAARADDFPSRPIKLVVPFGAGSVADIVGRKVSDKAGEILKTTFVVENRPGAGGAIGAEAVATAAPDGYTICLGTVASHAIAAAMEKLPYDPIKDFKPITLLVTTASLIVVNSAVPAKTLVEYLDYARKKGVSLYVSGGVATTTQLLPELIRVKLKVPLQHVPAAKVGDSYNDLVAGRVDMMCYPAIGLQPFLNSGAVRPLAVASPNRIKLLPDVPTVGEALGTTDFDLISWFGSFAPAQTADSIVATLSSALSSAVLSMTDDLEKIGVDARGWQVEKFSVFFHSDVPRWAEVVRLTGVSEAH